MDSDHRAQNRLSSDDVTRFARAAVAVQQARSLIVTAGAGMGVDSGLPDFRGDQGFWQAYPAYEKLGINFVQMATPRHFSEDPTFGWGFYGHRTNMYREAVPHAGFSILLEWIRRFELQWFVVTSNVDGQFQKAGFDEQRIVEVHGSIHHMQCHHPCKPEIWLNQELFDIEIDSMRSKHIPICIHCGDVARPNILMFNDWSFIPGRSNAQQHRFEQFLASCPTPLTVVELGAGSAVPTIRWTSEMLGRKQATTVIRINPREPEISAPHLSIAANGAKALVEINKALLAAQ